MDGENVNTGQCLTDRQNCHSSYSMFGYIHPLKPILIISHSLSSFMLWSIASSLFNLHVSQTFCIASLQVLFGLPLGLESSTTCCIHFFTQSLSFFCNTCPYHHNLFRCSTEIMSSIPSLSLISLLKLCSLHSVAFNSTYFYSSVSVIENSPGFVWCRLCAVPVTLKLFNSSAEVLRVDVDTRPSHIRFVASNCHSSAPQFSMWS